MASESGRVIKRKRIKLPGDLTVDIPVISQLMFSDPIDRGQETQIAIDNSTDSDRDVRIASIIGDGAATDEKGNGGPEGDTSKTLQVERIDLFRVVDIPSRAQESNFAPDSKTVAQPPEAPPFFTTHSKTHLVKYLKRNEDNDSEDKTIWIKSELIDQWSFGDAAERGQETQWALFNPPDNKDIEGLRFGTDEDDNNIPTISVDPSIEQITSGVGGSDEGDKPVRTDPFQNIVDWSAKPLVAILGWSWEFMTTTANATDFGPTPCNTFGPPGEYAVISPTGLFVCGWLKHQDYTGGGPVSGVPFQLGPGNSSYVWTGTATQTPMTITKGSNQVASALWPRPWQIDPHNDPGISPNHAEFYYRTTKRAEDDHSGNPLTCTASIPLTCQKEYGGVTGYYATPSIAAVNGSGVWVSGYLIPGELEDSGDTLTVNASMGKLIYTPDTDKPDATIEMECFAVRIVFVAPPFPSGNPNTTPIAYAGSIAAWYKRKGAKDPYDINEAFPMHPGAGWSVQI